MSETLPWVLACTNVQTPCTVIGPFSPSRTRNVFHEEPGSAAHQRSTRTNGALRRGPLLPHSWVSGDDETGRCSWFRQELCSRQERHLLAVPSNTTVRDLRAADPPCSGK